jgi:hypothetical protein
MVLSPHVIGAKDGHYVSVVRHPAGEKPSVIRRGHEVVRILGKLPRAWRLTDTAVTELLDAARAWIEQQTAIETLPVVPEYSLVARLRRAKKPFQERRRLKARILLAMRAGIPLADLAKQEEALTKPLAKQLVNRWRRLEGYRTQITAVWPRSPRRAAGGHQRISIAQLVAMVRLLAAGATEWKQLAVVAEPALSRATVFRYVLVLQNEFLLKVTWTLKDGWRVDDWGLFAPDRLKSLNDENLLC